MKTFVLIVVVLMCLGIAASADVFNLGAGFTNLETVRVGDAGNTADSTGYGSVGYNYNIGKYEVTAGQYTDFLNAVAKTDTYGLYNTLMWSTNAGCKIQQSGNAGSYSYTVAGDYANRPVNFVSFWDSCRFANWLGNGQGNGNTETGAYNLNGYNGDDGRTIQRNAGSTWVVTSEDEWYKAAYYKGGSTNAGYWLYPTQSDTAPGQDLTDASGNNANCYTAPYVYPLDSGRYTTVVGEFQNSESPYGTFDQGGNVWEWNEAIVYQDANFASRLLSGGSFNPSFDVIDLQSTHRYNGHNYPNYEISYFGFRVSQVPEPSSIIALLGGLAGLIRLRRCK